MPQSTGRSAFTAIRGITRFEGMLACALMVALAGVVAPVAGLQSKSEQVESIVSLCKALERATFRHYVDTRETATEFGGHDGDIATYHQLSHGQGNPRWNGPYLTSPLTDAANPCGGSVWLYPDLKGGVVSVGGGFDLMRRGRDSVSGRGQFVAFSDIPEDVASMVDRAVDGDSGAFGWRAYGRCEYDRVTRTLSVLVLQL